MGIAMSPIAEGWVSPDWSSMSGGDLKAHLLEVRELAEGYVSGPLPFEEGHPIQLNDDGSIEMPEQTEGLVRGFQLWLNLPKEKKMIEPAYNDIPADKIPIVNVPGGQVKIISGTFSGITGPGVSHTGILYYDILLDTGSEIIIPIENGWNGFCYVYEGSISCGQSVSKGHLAVLSTEDIFRCTAIKNNTRFILVAGMPLNEPVARGGPFVMNTKGEILQAFEDYQAGRLG